MLQPDLRNTAIYIEALKVTKSSRQAHTIAVLSLERIKAQEAIRKLEEEDRGWGISFGGNADAFNRV